VIGRVRNQSLLLSAILSIRHLPTIDLDFSTDGFLPNNKSQEIKGMLIAAMIIAARVFVFILQVLIVEKLNTAGLHSIDA
jgi:hypothetical protein